jgi:hypothetical protein
MLLSVHLADLGLARALSAHRLRARPGLVEGLVYAELTTLAPLGPRLAPTPTPGRLGLIAAWERESALEEFLERHPLARQLAGGWRVRLQPTRIFGAWPELPDVVPRELPMDAGEPVAALTLGRLRLAQAPRFLRASALAEGQALSEPGLLWSTGLGRPPRLVATFSIWRDVAALRDYVEGRTGAAHRAAVREQAERPFHRHSAFIRLRPYAAEGRWEGIPALPAGARQPAGHPGNAAPTGPSGAPA